VASAVAIAAISLESLMQVAARMGGGLLGDRVDPRWLLAGAQGMMAVGLLALGHATTWPLLMLFAVGVGIGFGLTCWPSASFCSTTMAARTTWRSSRWSAWWARSRPWVPVVGGEMRDRLGSFVPTFQVCAAIIGVIFVAACSCGRRARPSHKSRSPNRSLSMLQDAA
jgi:MFS family permease